MKNVTTKKKSKRKTQGYQYENRNYNFIVYLHNIYTLSCN